MTRSIRSLVLLALPALAPAQTQTGLDVLVSEDFARLRGTKVGLITNHTGRDQRGVSTVERFLEAQQQGHLALQALFCPEHGLEGMLDAKVADSVHATGLPVHSLYGDTRQPRAEHLAGLDTLVFDIQDIGCRFYTYISTMGLALEAASARGLRFVVLDRPNPINGVDVQGPVLDAGSESFVGHWRIPVRHGMTVGELARLLDAEKGLQAKLEIVALRGWQRAMTWDATGLAWINPSPNMRSLTQALLYPGVGLLETTNLSVGRGTDTPFQILGAPWLDSAGLVAALHAAKIPGLRCVARRFTPSASTFAGQECQGIELLVTDWSRFDPLVAGMHLACALRRQHADQWDTSAYGKLLGDAATLAAIREGKSAAEVMALWRQELAEFGKRRERVLVY